jgi:hypothetical protein
MWEFKSTSSELPSRTASNDSHLLTEPLPKQRRARGMTHAKLAARIALGNGLGSGSRYIPWLMLRRKNPSPDSNQVISRMPLSAEQLTTSHAVNITRHCFCYGSGLKISASNIPSGPACARNDRP